MTGDLNDYSDLVLDEAGSVPVSKVLKTLRVGNGTSEGKWALTNVAELIKDQSVRYSAWYDFYKDCQDDGGKDHTTIDHMLVSRGLHARLKQARYIHSYEVGCESDYSDHWPVVADFDFSQ